MTHERSEYYAHLLICYQTGQISERQWTKHLKDHDFETWLRVEPPNSESACEH